MQNIRPFQIALLAFFAILGIVSVILLARFQGFIVTDEQAYGDSVVVWGPFDEQTVSGVLREIARDDKAFNVVTYVEVDPREFDSAFVNAIAEGRAPDVVMLSHEQLVMHRTKLLPLPYETFPEREFKDRFIDGAEIFTRPDGVYALPLMTDPLVMYWNRDLFNAAGIAAPPSAWETVVGNIVPRLTQRDNNRNIVQSALAFGEYANVTYGKEVLLTLMLQSGSRLVEEESNGYRVLMDTPLETGGRPPMNAAVQFYTDFSNGNSSLYTWNRGFESDRLAFLGGDLATYFGFGSEHESLRRENPNLNFDMAQSPQGASATVRRVYGDFYGLALVRASQNPQGSFAAMLRIAADDVAGPLSTAFSMAPASRTLIAAGTDDPYRQVIMNAALIARGWLDPNPVSSDGIFAQMIDDIVSNRQKVANAVTDAVRRLELAF